MIPEPSNKQKQALLRLYDNRTLFVGYGGSARSGKSYLLCRWIVNNCLQYPGVGYGIGRRELTTLKRTTFLTLLKVMAEQGIKEGGFNYNGQLNILTFPNGSQIFLIDTAYKPSDPHYTRFGGYELTGLAIDESNETERLAVETLFTRIGWRLNSKHGIPKKMLETFNPDKGHVYDRYYEPYKNGKLPEHYAFIPALPSDNPSPDAAKFVEDTIKAGNRVLIERLVYGNFDYDEDKNALLGWDDITDLFTNDSVPTGDWCITADIARLGKDKTVICLWSGYRCERIEVIEKSDLVEVAERIRAMARSQGVPMSRVVVDEAGLGAGVSDMLRCKGFVSNVSPVQVKGLKENYANLKSQCSFRWAEKARNKSVYIAPSKWEGEIKRELGAIRATTIEPDGKLSVIKKEDEKNIVGHSPDFKDALIMREFLDLQPSQRIIAVL